MRKFITITTLLLNQLAVTLFGVNEKEEQEACALLSQVNAITAEIGKVAQQSYRLPLLNDHILDVENVLQLYQKNRKEYILDLKIRLGVLAFQLEDQLILAELGEIDISQKTVQEIAEKREIIEGALEPKLKEIRAALDHFPEEVATFIVDHYAKASLEKRTAAIAVKSEKVI